MDKKQSHTTEIMTQEENNHEQTLEGLTNTIHDKIGEGAKNTESYFSTACIYRVPEEIRKLKESAYTPSLIAIGPLHRYDKHLQTPMQHVKMSYTNHLLRRLTEVIQDQEFAEKKRFTFLQECVAAMQESIGEVKRCYGEEVHVDEEMMLVDGCFILEHFYRSYLSLPQEVTNGGDHGGSSNVSKPGASTSTLSTPLLQASIGPNKEERILRQSVFHERPKEVAPASSSAIPKPDPISDSSWTLITVQLDLLLLENQIPFFVLERLFSLTVARIDKISLTELVDLFFCNIMSTCPEEEEENYHHILHTAASASPSDCVVWIPGNKATNGEEEEKKCYHILHKIHEYYLPCDGKNKKEDEEEEKKKNESNRIEKEETEDEEEEKKKNKRCHFIPPASALDFAGIKFAGTKPKGKDTFKVTFDEPKKGLFWLCHLASFEMPTVGLYDSTEPFLRNLIALEQCVPRISQHFTSYASLMDMLVNSDKDVQVLEKAGVLHNYLGRSKDATDLFNNLCKEVVVGEFFFDEICNKATEYSRLFWPKNLAYVKRTYFASPWTFIAFVVGFIVFVITVTSFVLSLLS